MKIYITIVFSCLVLLNCTPKESKQSVKFEKNENHEDFTQLIPKNDTLRIMANLSVCTSFRKEENLFYYKGDHIYLTTIYSMYGKEKDTLDEIIYAVHDDSLSFEGILSTLYPISHPDSLINDPYIQISYSSDTIQFGAGKTLTDKLTAINDYLAMKFKLYGNLHLYKPLPIRCPSVNIKD